MPENAYKKNFDPDTFKEIRPVRTGLYRDKSGVYLSGFFNCEGEDAWKEVEAGTASLKSVFKYSKCKELFTEANTVYSHRAMINEDSLWGIACCYAPLNGADSKSFKHIRPNRKRVSDHDGDYFRDAKHVYFLNGDKDVIFKVKTKSPSSFIVHDTFAQDDKYAFFMGKKIPKSNAVSFRKRDGHYCYEDAEFIYENDNWHRVNITPK